MSQSETHTCSCGIEITTGLQFSLCPRADKCELWGKGHDPETELAMWRMWAEQARNAFMQQREEHERALSSANGRIAELREALRELLESDTLMPTFDEGLEAQNAWADRRANARHAARAALAKEANRE